MLTISTTNIINPWFFSFLVSFPKLFNKICGFGDVWNLLRETLMAPEPFWFLSRYRRGAATATGRGLCCRIWQGRCTSNDAAIVPVIRASILPPRMQWLLDEMSEHQACTLVTSTRCAALSLENTALCNKSSPQEVIGKHLLEELFGRLHLLVCKGYNAFSNHLLTFWDTHLLGGSSHLFGFVLVGDFCWFYHGIHHHQTTIWIHLGFFRPFFPSIEKAHPS